ncbi:hypothetical protein LXA43DRAFT_1132551, partial [Ganoderma leucocontextum]
VVGVLTVLVLTSIYFLICRGSVAQTNVRILLLGTVLLYVSTATYMAALIWAWSNGNNLIAKAKDGLFSPSYDARDDIAAFEHAIQQQSWMLTIAAGVNLVIGDATVWWRACVIWQNKVVNCTGMLLVTLTLGMSQSFMFACSSSRHLTPPTFVASSECTKNAYAQASAVLSLATNVLATSLIGYKAWEHRQLMKRHFAGAGTASRVLKALALLIESGCIYCALLIIVIIYQAVPVAPQAGPEVVFMTVAGDFTYGCFVPIVAIYPTIIVVLVALKRSPIDTGGLSQVRQVHGHGSGTAEGGTSSTIVFHHSTFRTSAGVETEGVTEGIPVGNRRSTHSLETKVLGNLA